jgi:transcriptional regulator with XRE-family HTH domain
MSSRKSKLIPNLNRILIEVGENIKLARLRRKLSSEQVAERAYISRPTLSSIEKGSASVSIGSYLQVMFVFGLEKDFLTLAKDDVLGRKLQDAGLLPKERAPKKPKKNE